MLAGVMLIIFIDTRMKLDAGRRQGHLEGEALGWPSSTKLPS